jgi:hypothetical protein
MAIVAGGPPAVSIVYAPALVAFIGGGGWGASLSFGGAAVGWVPLGPGEVYAPAYQVSQNYFRTVNVSNTTVVNTVNITNVYNNVYVTKNVTNVTVNQHFVNMAAPNAVTAMPQNAFASGRPVKQVGVSVPRNQISQIQPAAMVVAPSVAPVKQALAPMAGTGNASRPPARAFSAPVVAKVAPPPPPVSFAAKQSALQQNLGRPVNIQAIRQSLPPARPAAAAAVVHVAPPARQVVPQVRQVQAAPQNAMRPVQPSAPATPAYRPPAAQPAPQNNPRPVQPNAPVTPTYRPPAAAPPAHPAPQNNPRPVQPNPPATPAYRPPAPQNNPRPAQPPPQKEQKPPAKPPKKEKEEDKGKEQK